MMELSMSRKGIYLALALMWSVALKAAGEGAVSPDVPADGFAPYQTILDRMPFGPVPPGFDPEAPPRGVAGAQGAAGEAGTLEAQQAEEETRLAAAVRVSVLNVTPSGAVAVGFTDSSAQPPVHYYLKVGETREAWHVKAADPAEQTVVLVKDGIEAELKVGEGTSGGGRSAETGRSGAARAHAPMTLQASKQDAAAPAAAGRPLDLRERLRARRLRTIRDIQNEDAAAAKAKEAAARAEEERKAAAEQAAAERAQQREALMAIQEELRRTREAREAQEATKQQQAETQNAEGEE